MYVLFLDILGSASQIEALGRESEKVLRSELFTYQQGGVFASSESLPEGLWSLTSMYSSFHEIIFEAAQQHVDDWDSRCAIFEFSDSMFFATDEIGQIIEFSQTCMHRLYQRQIPARGGIACGSFAALTVTMQQSPRGDRFVHCPFLGSAVVRAYRCERSGKGLRVFIHPSCMVDIRSSQYWRKWLSTEILPLDKDERSEFATHEINLLPSWSSKEILEKLTTMSSKASDAVSHHYKATQRAMTGMKAACVKRARRERRQSEKFSKNR